MSGGNPKPGKPNRQSNALTAGGFLKEARTAAGLSINQLAKLVDARPSQVLRWERDEHLPSGASLLRLAQTLELAPSDLFRLAGLPVPAEALSLPAMLRREYDLPPAAVAEIQRNIERVARKYQDRSKRKEGNHEHN